MKLQLFTAALTTATLLVAADRTEVVNVSNIRAVQDKDTEILTVTYDLTNQDGEPAFVTFDILTNNVSIGKTNFKTLSGNVSIDSDTLVTPGTNLSFTWNAYKDWRGNHVTNADVVVTAYYSNRLDRIPGIYMRLDLNEGQTAESYPIRYSLYGPSVDESGYANDTDDKDRYMWLRRLESGTFVQGDNKTTSTRNVTLSKPFFFGVFPITRAQYERVIDRSNPSTSGTIYAPAVLVSYEEVRGSTNVVDWPNTVPLNTVAEGTFLAALRGRTNLDFDLPTEAQWEYACRAGTTNDFNSGTDMSPTNYWIEGVSILVTNTQYAVSLAEIAWFGNSYSIGVGNATYVQPVGLRKPNRWGIYDCHGNVVEFCNDWYNGAVGTDPVTDPVGPTVPVSGKEGRRVGRGGSCRAKASGCTSFSRSDLVANWFGYNNVGFRLICPAQ